MLRAKPFHYHNDGSGRDSYVNCASATVGRSGKIVEPAVVLHDVLGDSWPSPQTSRERSRREKLEASLSGTQSLSASQSPRFFGRTASSQPRPPAEFHLEEIISSKFAVSPARSPVQRDGECSPNAPTGRVHLPVPRGAAQTPSSPTRPLHPLYFLESTTHRAQRLGRYQYATERAKVPAVESQLPGIKHGPTYYGVSV